MINNNAEVYGILSKIAPTKQYAMDMTEQTVFPCIEFAMRDCSDTYYADGQARASVYEVEVEVHQKRVNGVLKEIHFEVANAMKANGYHKVFYDYIYDEDNNIYNHIFRFEKTLLYDYI